MAEVPIPFTEEEVDTSSGARGVAMTLAAVIAGFAVLAWSRDVGGYVADRVNSFLTSLLGVDPTSGESDDGLGFL